MELESPETRILRRLFELQSARHHSECVRDGFANVAAGYIRQIQQKRYGPSGNVQLVERK